MGKIIAILLLVIPLIINIIVIFRLPQIFAVKKFGIIDKIYDILIGDLENFGNFVITCSAVTAAVVILCYSVLDSKKLGVSMRGVIRNWMGGIFLPEIFMLMLIKLPFLKLWAYSHQDYILFIGCILSLIEQAVMVVFVLISNSMHAVVYTIINEEYKRYKQYAYHDLAIYSDNNWSGGYSISAKSVQKCIDKIRDNIVRACCGNVISDILNKLRTLFRELFSDLACLYTSKYEFEEYKKAFHGTLRLKKVSELELSRDLYYKLRLQIMDFFFNEVVKKLKNYNGDALQDYIKQVTCAYWKNQKLNKIDNSREEYNAENIERV